MISGKVTPPDNLNPAIEALGPKGTEYLYVKLEAGVPLSPDLLAKAADYGREYGEP